MPTDTPAQTFKIDRPGKYATRDGRTVMVGRNTSGDYMATHPWRGDDGLTRDNWGSFREGDDTSPSKWDIIARHPDDITPASKEPSRLDRAKAVLEEAQRKEHAAFEAYHVTSRASNYAQREVEAAEKEAASLATIPPLLLEVAREVTQRDARWADSPGVLVLLARSHGIPPETLRAALEVK